MNKHVWRNNETFNDDSVTVLTLEQQWRWLVILISGRDADIMRERGQVWNYSEAEKEPQLANYNTDGRYLSEATNFELYNFC